MKDLAVCLILIGLFIATLLLVGQRDEGLRAMNDRIASLEKRAYKNIPSITISGRTTVYAGDKAEIVIERIGK